MLINNGLAEIPTLALLFIVGEHREWGHSFGGNPAEGTTPYTAGDYVLLVVSCVVGTVISWAGLNAQASERGAQFDAFGSTVMEQPQSGRRDSYCYDRWTCGISLVEDIDSARQT